MNLAKASKYMIGLFRSYIISGKPQNKYLYKTALSRRWLRFHQPGDVVKSPRSYDFLKQIELDDIVDNMKKFDIQH